MCVVATGCGGSKSPEDMTEEDMEAALEKYETYYEDDDDNPANNVDDDEEEEADATESDAEEINPFDYLNVTCSGFAPMGSISLSADSSAPTTITFTANQSSNLSNGDIVIITAETTSSSYTLSQTTQEYTVSGLDSYATKIDDIPDDMQEKMLQQANDSITADGATWSEGNSIKSLDFVGYYFLKGKEGFDASPYNKIYCVYKVTAQITGKLEGDEEGTEAYASDEVYYTYFRYSDIMILKDGTCTVDLSQGSMSSNSISTEHGYWSWGYFETYSLPGYKDLDSMFNDCITQNVANYEYENTVSQ
jgi:hypothetical protein